MNRNTLRIIEMGIELAALGRAALSTWLVVGYITGGNMPYTAFTVFVIEGVFLVSLLLLRQSSIAPITAIAALVFTAVTQVMELQVLDGTITVEEREIMRYVIALAPVTILALAYIQRLFEDVDMAEVVGKVTEAIAPARYPAREQLTEAEVAPPLPAGRTKQPLAARNGASEP